MPGDTNTRPLSRTDKGAQGTLSIVQLTVHFADVFPTYLLMIAYLKKSHQNKNFSSISETLTRYHLQTKK